LFKQETQGINLVVFIHTNIHNKFATVFLILINFDYFMINN